MIFNVNEINVSEAASKACLDAKTYANKDTSTLTLNSCGFNAALSSESNSERRNAIRVTITTIAAALACKNYEVNKTLFDELMKLVDRCYHDAESMRKNLQINVCFDWKDAPTSKGGVTPVNRKKIQNVVSVRIGVFYKAEHAYDIEGIFAKPNIK